MFVSKAKYLRLNRLYNEMTVKWFEEKNEVQRAKQQLKTRTKNLEEERDKYKKMYYDEVQKRFELIEILKKVNGDKNVQML